MCGHGAGAGVAGEVYSGTGEASKLPQGAAGAVNAWKAFRGVGEICIALEGRSLNAR